MQLCVIKQGKVFSCIDECDRMEEKGWIEYGWNSTVFTTVENFWAARGFLIPELDADESDERLRKQILLLNPMAEEKTIRKCIRG